MQNHEYAKILTDVLELVRQPAAVRFITESEEVPDNYTDDYNLSFCQFLMMAQRGYQLFADLYNVSCPNGAAALGLCPLPEEIRNGQVTLDMGVYASQVEGARVSALTPRLEKGKYRGILISPLAKAEFEPQVVVFQGRPFNIMWLMAAENYKRGTRLNFSTALCQGTCVDAVIVPFLNGDINLSLACYNSRNATDIGEDEILIGIPYEHLGDIVYALPRLKSSIITRSRAKPMYKLCMEENDFDSLE